MLEFQDQPKYSNRLRPASQELPIAGALWLPFASGSTEARLAPNALFGYGTIRMTTACSTAIIDIS
jgi:hypothetical protein